MTQKPVASFSDIDHSDRLAYESVLIEQLTDLDPDGRWKSHELYQRRQQRKYGGLTVGQMDQLLDELEAELQAIPAEKIRQWLARHPPESPEDDAQNPNYHAITTPLA